MFLLLAVVINPLSDAASTIGMCHPLLLKLCRYHHATYLFAPPVQCQQPLEGPVIALDLSVGKQAIDNPGADAMHDDALDGDIQQAPPEPFPGAAPAQTRLTPRKLHRKAAPKRKRVGGVQKEAQDAAVPGAVSMQFLLSAFPAYALSRHTATHSSRPLTAWFQSVLDENGIPCTQRERLCTLENIRKIMAA